MNNNSLRPSSSLSPNTRGKVRVMLCDMSSLHVIRMSLVRRTYVTGTSKLHNIPPGWPQGQLKTRVVHSSHFRAIFGSFWSHFLISFLKNGLQNEPKMNYFWKIEAYPRFCKNHHFSVHFHFPFFLLFQTPLQFVTHHHHHHSFLRHHQQRTQTTLLGVAWGPGKYFFFPLRVFYILTSTFQVRCRLARYEDSRGQQRHRPNDTRRGCVFFIYFN